MVDLQKTTKDVRSVPVASVTHTAVAYAQEALDKAGIELPSHDIRRALEAAAPYMQEAADMSTSDGLGA